MNDNSLTNIELFKLTKQEKMQLVLENQYLDFFAKDPHPLIRNEALKRQNTKKEELGIEVTDKGKWNTKFEIELKYKF